MLSRAASAFWLEDGMRTGEMRYVCGLATRARRAAAFGPPLSAPHQGPRFFVCGLWSSHLALPKTRRVRQAAFASHQPTRDVLID